MEMSSRRKLVGPDLSKLLVWWALRSQNGKAYYDHRSRVVVCGPAAAVERAEEGAHFGAEGLWWRGGHVVHGESGCVLNAATSSNRRAEMEDDWVGPPWLDEKSCEELGLLLYALSWTTSMSACVGGRL